jgi:hypothetical protein
MRRALLLDTFIIILALLVCWASLATIPATNWVLARAGEQPLGWSLQPLLALLLLVLAVAVIVWRARHARALPLPLPPIPGLPVRAAGYLAAALAGLGTLVLFWWLVAGARNLPVGRIGFGVGVVAITVPTVLSLAGSLLWLGRTGTKADEALAEDEVIQRPVGLG